MRKRTVIVNDMMQRGYRYQLTEQAGRAMFARRALPTHQALVRFGAGAANGTKIFYPAARRWRDRPLKGRRNHEGCKALRHARLT